MTSEEKPVELLPIDIHYNKLLDWLISRRHCNHQWQASALLIREKINNAIQDMPEQEEITTLLTGTYINYFHCKRIVELLKETEKSTKNIFGRYSSQRMKDWQEIVSMYESNGVNLAEAAQMLMRNVNYEIPSLKRQIEKCQKAQQECTRKESDYASQAVEQREKFYASCKHMGIEGKRVKTELVALVKDLPAVLEGVATVCKELQPAMDYYKAFIDFTLDRSDFSVLPLLGHVVDKGNSTVYEWRTGNKPDTVEEITFNYVVEDEEVIGEQEDVEIDWGDPVLDTGGDSIDFGDDIAIEVSAEGSAIDWGAGDVTVESSSEQEGNTAKGPDAITVLDAPSTRNLFVDDLMELECFLKQRLSETKSESDFLSSSQFQNAPPSVQVSADQLTNMKNRVTDIVSQMTSNKMRELFMIRSSPRYVDRLAEQLKSVLSMSEKMEASKRLMVQKRAEALEEQRATEPKVGLIREKTKILQKQIEKEISKKYQNRPVNIMGEINTI
ncbi:CDK5 regulatory subunit-associated protein 3 [Lingula anatina]|uniref:CDK5 regulatory subunit-associated protein 3 n=1 Tax=Lingula anatina TaxID=7574 RepID=A0A1S3JUE8_LINAN|nr:CDK5 regulatory subunit-associated protein 3 [Lingula anatina]|eukprot:XP_013413714.1 CDK5 regulatory subunit-associated protein 3 [Lingula anatina]